MKRTIKVAAALFGVLVLAAGCVSECPPEVSDIRTAVAAACERRLVPKTVELLEELAENHLGRERLAARLEAASNDDCRGRTAENDPRFNWLLEAELYADMVFSAPGETTPEKRMEPVVRGMLRFEQRMLWAKFASLKERPADDRERRECVLALELTTGWDPARIETFDLASLEVPERGGVGSAKAVRGDASASLRAAAELLLVDPQESEAKRELISAKLVEIRSGRVALAVKYLRAAEAEYAAKRDSASLAAWRIAKARCDFESQARGAWNGR